MYPNSRSLSHFSFPQSYRVIMVSHSLHRHLTAHNVCVCVCACARTRAHDMEEVLNVPFSVRSQAILTGATKCVDGLSPVPLDILQHMEHNFFSATSSISKNKSNNYANVPHFSVTAHLTGVCNMVWYMKWYS
jgi:hypothetical protein